MLIYKNAVAKIVTSVAPSHHPFQLNNMVAPPMFLGGEWSMQQQNSLLSGLLYAMSMGPPDIQSPFTIIYQFSIHYLGN
jgi:hypothetical protein